jgi:Ca2+/Na+ antiporter
MFAIGIFILILTLLALVFTTSLENSTDIDKSYYVYFLLLFIILYNFGDNKVVLQIAFLSIIIIAIKYSYAKSREKIKNECFDFDDEIEKYKHYLEFLRFVKNIERKNLKIVSYDNSKCLIDQKYYDEFFHFMDLKIQYEVHMRYYDSLDDGMLYVSNEDLNTIKLMDKFYNGKAN